jgi:hypothetical protein
MLIAEPHGWFSRTYNLHWDGQFVARIDLASFRETAEVEIVGQRYRLFREGLLGGAFVLKKNGRTMARAVKPSWAVRRFEIEWEGRQLELEATSMFSWRFVLRQGESELGDIRRVGWFRRKAEVDLPSDLPLPIQVFLMWLVMILWRRADQS